QVEGEQVHGDTGGGTVMKEYTYIIDCNDRVTKHQPVFEVDGEFGEGGKPQIHSFRIYSSDKKVRDMELTDYLSSWTIKMLTQKFREAHDKALDEEEITPEEVNNIKAEMEFDRRRDEA
ncbi:MAG: hypothetical protein H7831_16320, partial [Magnetococcus sp. WYHC-3]